jgi:DNA processing protein
MVSQQREVREILPETPLEETLLTCLGVEPTHIDAIVRQSGLATATVSSTLALMELKGMVQRADHMSYVKRF